MDPASPTAKDAPVLGPVQVVPPRAWRPCGAPPGQGLRSGSYMAASRSGTKARSAQIRECPCFQGIPDLPLCVARCVRKYPPLCTLVVIDSRGGEGAPKGFDMRGALRVG